MADAIERVMDDFPNLYVDLVGNDQIKDDRGRLYKEEFIRRNEKQSWNRRVRFHGIVDDDALNEFYRSCDIFVAPSLYESFGLIFVEAWQFAKPVIGTWAGGIPEVVRDKVDGLLVQPGDGKELADAIRTLVADPELRKTLGAEGRSRAHDVFSSDALAKGMLDFYHDVIAATKDRYQGQLEKAIPETIDLFNNSKVEIGDTWSKRDALENRTFLMTSSCDSPLAIHVNAASCRFYFLYHGYSGIVKISVENKGDIFFDLYQDNGCEVRPVDVNLGSVGKHKIILSLHGEKNPLSQGSELWLEKIEVYRTENSLGQRLEDRILGDSALEPKAYENSNPGGNN